MRNTKKTILAALVIALLGYWGIKSMEKSESELFNQLIEIMESNAPKPGGREKITELVCPLVSSENLNAMMEDEYASKRMIYSVMLPSTINREGDVSWWVKRKNWRDKEVWYSSILTLVITINNIDRECDATIIRRLK